PRLASCSLCFLLTRRPPRSTLFPYTTSSDLIVVLQQVLADVVVARFDLLLRLLQRLVHPGVNDGLAFLEAQAAQHGVHALRPEEDRKSTRLNSSHVKISYAVFCLKKKSRTHH